MGIERVLVVDDEALIRKFLIEILQRKKIEVIGAENGKAAFDLIKHHSFDLVISDIKMPEMSGIELLKVAKQLHPQLIFILITAYASVQNAIEAMRLGAFNYLIKPFSLDTIEAMIDKAEEQFSLLEENQYLRQEISHEQRRKLDQIIAESQPMKQTLQDVAKIAKSHANVLICGESGTGKEVIAHAIHFQSARAQGPFVKVNCAAIPEALIESELFGHEKGAFTGAIQRRLGRFELADRGTLLLDEISEIPPSSQSKLLRVIQEKEFERVGGVKPVRVDVRLIATSNRNMKEAVEQKLFREDLYYRLNVMPILLPPLRERKEDILPLAEYFLERFCIDNHKPRKRLSQEARKKLTDYPWPGNIRELANIIERTVVMDSSDLILADHLAIDPSPSCPIVSSQGALISLKEIEKRHILETLSTLHYNRTRAAEALGISVRTLRNKLKELR
jgi:two-component system, NtrC family, response regulator AtoC